jgi:hypothetical protein
LVSHHTKNSAAFDSGLEWSLLDPQSHHC